MAYVQKVIEYLLDLSHVPVDKYGRMGILSLNGQVFLLTGAFEAGDNIVNHRNQVESAIFR